MKETQSKPGPRIYYVRRMINLMPMTEMWRGPYSTEAHAHAAIVQMGKYADYRGSIYEVVPFEVSEMKVKS